MGIKASIRRAERRAEEWLGDQPVSVRAAVILMFLVVVSVLLLTLMCLLIFAVGESLSFAYRYASKFF